MNPSHAAAPVAAQLTAREAMRVWLHKFGAVDSARLAEIAQALAQVGIATEAMLLDKPFDTGLLIFNEVTPDLVQFIRAFSRSGLQRLIGIATTQSALANGNALRVLQAGASDVFAWGSDPTQPSTLHIKARLERWRNIDATLASPLLQNNLIGHSPAWISALRQVVELVLFADTAADSGASVLITGETGTGKELVARLIHTLDDLRKKRDLVVLDCTTVVPELAGSELFGHERGAFTGAIAARAGAFEMADGGTLFLDEVGELPLAMQAQLLRVVQERTYKRVGGNTWHKADFRLVCATNRNLMDEEREGRFRRDLLYRLASITLHLPPLRERAEDIVVLAQHFLRQLLPNLPDAAFDAPLREYLLTRDYPGNIRDLRNLITRIALRHVGSGPITLGDLPHEELNTHEAHADWRDASFDLAVYRALASGAGLKDIRREAEEVAIRLAVGEAEGNLQRAAKRLGVTDRALQLRRAEQRERLSDSSAVS